ncbi:hypothetical protein ACMSIO_24550, partial [Pseudomonas benzopyrenica]|uniref:hypothetical protein n=1 Tax=Pseudomonas benzopyrenica TaxID=2993566 RepID=UPI0039C3AEF6
GGVVFGAGKIWSDARVPGVALTLALSRGERGRGRCGWELEGYLTAKVRLEVCKSTDSPAAPGCRV